MSTLIVALDYPDAASAKAMAAQLDPAKVILKIGKELFVSAGPALVDFFVQKGFRLFLDLKFHDIPNTVAGAVRAAARLNVWMVNVHAAGGRAMLDAARHALDDFSDPPLLTAVTVLTSLSADSLAETGVAAPVEEQVKRLATLSRDCGLDGVVCSAREAEMLRDICPPPFCLVTPGIRPKGMAAGDQQRIMTPAAASRLGIDHLVIGRPITQAKNPAAAVDEILQQMSV